MEYKKKVLLIGGSGIISSSICNKAVDEGMQVSIVNRGRRKKFINENANLIKADIRNESIDDLREKINVAQYDVVMDFITYNTQQLKKILSVIKGNCKQYIFVSSATAYKECDEHHIYRDDDPIGNESWKYSVDKSECEWFLARHKEELGFEYTIVRPYVTYGCLLYTSDAADE